MIIIKLCLYLIYNFFCICDHFTLFIQSHLIHLCFCDICWIIYEQLFIFIFTCVSFLLQNSNYFLWFIIGFTCVLMLILHLLAMVFELWQIHFIFLSITILPFIISWYVCNYFLVLRQFTPFPCPSLQFKYLSFNFKLFKVL